MSMTSQNKRARRRNPRGQGDKLREDLLAAASAIVAADGTARGLSLSSVARAVGIAATSVYLHFPDIDELKRALVIRGFAEMSRRRVATAPEGGDPAAHVLARWHAYAQFAIDNPGLYRLMFGPELPPAMAFDAPDSPGRQAFMSGVEAIAHAQQAGAAAAPDDPFRLTSLAWATVHGLVSLRIDRPNFPWPPLEAMIDDALRRLLLMAAH
jgi:AcrR family transcriptional regulator